MTDFDKEHTQSHVRLFVAIVIVISVLEVCGQTCIRKYRDNGRVHYIIVGIALYLAIVLLIFHTHRYHGMGIVNLLWSCISIIMAMFVGIVIFKEKFNSYMMIAILFAFAAIVFANLSQNTEKK